MGVIKVRSVCHIYTLSLLLSKNFNAINSLYPLYFYFFQIVAIVYCNKIKRRKDRQLVEETPLSAYLLVYSPALFDKIYLVLICFLNLEIFF